MLCVWKYEAGVGGLGIKGVEEPWEREGMK